MIEDNDLEALVTQAEVREQAQEAMAVTILRLKSYFTDFDDNNGAAEELVLRYIATAILIDAAIRDEGGEFDDSSRKVQEAVLVRGDLFFEPWISMVAQEFSGPGLSPEEIILLKNLPSTHSQEMESKVSILVEFMNDGGVRLDEDDIVLIATLVVQATILRKLKWSADRFEREMLDHGRATLLRRGKNDPTWMNLLETLISELA